MCTVLHLSLHLVDVQVGFASFVCALGHLVRPDLPDHITQLLRQSLT